MSNLDPKVKPAASTSFRSASRLRIDGYALLALGFTIFAWAALLSPNYFMNAHDAHHSLFFPIEFYKGIQDGYWLPRWGADFAHGYGYPMMVFYAPLTFYLWTGIHALGLFGTVATTKITFILGFLLAAAGMYAYARDLWGRRAGLLASVVYTYLPYHLLNIYVRAALAEFMAMSLLPWIALAFRKLVHYPSLKTIAAAGLTYGALLWTHNITAVLFTPLLGALILFEMWQRASIRQGEKSLWGYWARQQVLPIGISIVLGVLLGTAVWLPGLSEQGDIKIEQWALQTYQYSDHFVYPSQLFSPDWGFDYSVPGVGDGMSFQLGTTALILAVIGGYGLLRKEKGETGGRTRDAEMGTSPPDPLSVAERGRTATHHLAPSQEGKSTPQAHVYSPVPLGRGRTATHPLAPSQEGEPFFNQAYFVFYGISLLILVALLLPPAIAIWDLTPVSTLIQFPWRLLGVSGFCLALVASSAAKIGTEGAKQTLSPALALMVVAVLVTNSAYTLPEMTPPNPRDETQQTWRDYERKHPDMVAMVAQTEEQPAASPMLADLEANRTPQRFVSDTPGVTIEQLYVGGGSARARIETTQPATIRFLTYWYPGWYATLDGAPLPIQQDEGPLGLMVVEVPAGEHILAFRFGDTPARGAANLVSLVSLLVLVGMAGVGAWRGQKRIPQESVSRH